MTGPRQGGFAHKVMLKSRMIADRMRGLDFLSIVHPEEVGLDGATAFRSSPSGDRYLADVIGSLGITCRDSIIDIGCGKGSAMRTMLDFPFARVDGIELSGEIGRIAASNMTKLKAANARVIVGDAASFTGYGSYNMLYFYNPFPDCVMSAVLDRVVTARGRLQEETVLIYNNPLCHELIAGHGFFRKVQEHPDQWGNKIFVYSTLGDKSPRVACGG
jgi:SAM-dependent methyltransferase